MPHHVCPHCGKGFIGRKGRKYCSFSCRTSAINMTKRGTKMSHTARAKMTKSRTGKSRVFSDKHRANIGEASRRRWAAMTPERRGELISQWGGKAPRANTGPERIVAAVLRQCGVRYTQQYAIDRFVVDFFLPDANTVLEVNGEYWHSLRGMPERDAERQARLESLGFTFVAVTDTEVNQDVTAALHKVGVLK